MNTNEIIVATIAVIISGIAWFTFPIICTTGMLGIVGFAKQAGKMNSTKSAS